MPKRLKSQDRQRVALVLQGGGALGAYQAGVAEALCEHGLMPDWVVGTSVGAVNAAIVVGNDPGSRVARLREFWASIKHADLFDLRRVPDPLRRFNTWVSTLDAVIGGVPGFFAPRLFSPFFAGLPVPPEQASFYDTSQLAPTLARLVDFERLGRPGVARLTVNAMCATTGEFVSFDSSRQRLGVEHVMASSALPPGFPPVRIDGKLFWDGGLYSNTPLQVVLDDEPRVNTLCFMVDLWNIEGPEPRSFEEVQMRQKDIMYASRSRRHIEDYRRLHKLRNALHAMHARLPPRLRDEPAMLEIAASGCHTTMHIVHLRYAGQDWRMASKDINFSSGSIDWRWGQGYADATRILELAPWRAPQRPDVGVVVHEVLPRTVHD